MNESTIPQEAKSPIEQAIIAVLSDHFYNHPSGIPGKGSIIGSGVLRNKLLAAIAPFVAPAPTQSAVNQAAGETPAINTNVRLFDLVRQMRQELHRADLITDDEYAWLSGGAPMANSKGGGSPSPRRLEDYDQLRSHLAKLSAEREMWREKFGAKEGETPERCREIWQTALDEQDRLRMELTALRNYRGSEVLALQQKVDLLTRQNEEMAKEREGLRDALSIANRSADDQMFQKREALAMVETMRGALEYADEMFLGRCASSEPLTASQYRNLASDARDYLRSFRALRQEAPADKAKDAT